MMKVYLYLVSFILWFYVVRSTQPYFPPQIVFSPDNGTTILAIDEINQRAYQSMIYNPSSTKISYAFKHFPFAEPDSPQSKYYVQLLIDSPSNNCQYGTYWKYGGNNFNTFPPHWWISGNSFVIKNYMNFMYGMIHSNESSVNEDYWYSNVTCHPDSGEVVPCQEIYFKKNTEIPLRFTQVVRRGWDLIQVTRNFQIISIGKIDEKYFDTIPKNWFVACRDFNLRLLFYPGVTKINLKQSSEIHISLVSPPHRINGNDTIRIQWNATSCHDCLTWTPKVLDFNGQNFQKEQILTITRVKDGPQTIFVPIFNGGGFDLIPPNAYFILIQ